MEQNITIIGAGIGGLTTALALRQNGKEVGVYEGADEIKPIGAGIIIANNAMQVFRSLGVHDRVAKAGNRISAMKITDPRLRVLSVVDLSRYESRYGLSNTAIHRGKLQEILVDALGMDAIHLSRRLINIEKTDEFRLHFECGQRVTTRYLIGADGIRSEVRRWLFPESTLRSANQVCLRGICELELPHQYQHELNEAWGRGKRFGFVKISDRQVYWYALTDRKMDIADLESHFHGFHPDVLKIIEAGTHAPVFTSDIFDLKPLSHWYLENACLVGDAAHATTPNMGQGACQAIEDAYVLGKTLSTGLPVSDAFQHYQAIRKKKALRIVGTSRAIGRIAHIDTDWGVWLRNNLMRWTPAFLNQKQMDTLFKLD
jgi:2-polyprenyl-6-methoxyphenol hydroxylase-like FAD-dependent oxidoreductase